MPLAMLGPGTNGHDTLPAKLAHRRTPTAEDFPLPTKQPYVVTKRDQGLVSPAKSSFTFSDEEHLPHVFSSLPSMDDSPTVRVVERGTPGDLSTASSVENTPQHRELSRQRSQYYAETFANREPLVNPRDRVHKDSIIMADIKTNVIVRDEFLLLNELSQHLSQRFQRPTSSIFITLDHSACLLFASSFDSAYILTITALPSQIMPSTNKRNAALMQSFMTSALGVLPDRGVVKFIGLEDDYIATGGLTVTGQIERLQRTQNNDSKISLLPAEPVPRKPSRRATQKKPPALSLVPKSQSMPGSRMPSPTMSTVSTMNGQSYNSAPRCPALPAMPIEPSALDKKAMKMQRVGKRKSFMAMFGR
ncbi:uncharacterized protein KY384_006632 [Bacidia gigantensis]|uniref:uncharacterized protein n=1 Tax=Bacidia gigantensis TaxID=2732470 RepID=UPI001D053041|nr:uncharacterized protein KY384_006632 [Bacidia gigantensis]KAG8528943.1 hypothetical protein KY384_006632 [Bacidia gigantensis]